MKLFSFLKLFRKKEPWYPIYFDGEILVCNCANLSPHVKMETMICKILRRDELTEDHYYRVVSDLDLMTDAKGDPVDFYLHESNIISMVNNLTNPKLK